MTNQNKRDTVGKIPKNDPFSFSNLHAPSFFNALKSIALPDALDWRFETRSDGRAPQHLDVRPRPASVRAAHGMQPSPKDASRLDLAQYLSSARRSRNIRNGINQSIATLQSEALSTLVSAFNGISVQDDLDWRSESQHTLTNTARFRSRKQFTSALAARRPRLRFKTATDLDLASYIGAFRHTVHAPKRLDNALTATELKTGMALRHALQSSALPEDINWREESDRSTLAIKEMLMSPKFTRDLARANRHSVDGFSTSLSKALNATQSYRLTNSGSERDFALDKLAPFNIGRLAQLGRDAPETAGFLILIELRSAVAANDHSRVSVLFNLAKHLQIAPRFCLALDDIEHRWRRAGRHADDLLALDMFLHAVGWRVPHPDATPSGTDIVSYIDMKPWVAVDIGQKRHKGQSAPARWVVSGAVPLAWIGQVKTKALTIVAFGAKRRAELDDTCLSRMRQSDTEAKIVTSRDVVMVPYSVQEEQLSALTSQVARKLVGAIKEVLGPELQRDWIDTLDLVLDDYLFSTCREFWTEVCAQRDLTSASNGVICGSPELAGAFLGALQHENMRGRSRIVGPHGFAPTKTDDPAILLDHLVELATGAHQYADAQPLRKGAAVAINADVQPTAFPRGAVLLAGRKHDRNYLGDLKELGHTIQQQNLSVTFLPTAIRSLAGRAAQLFANDDDDWYAHVVQKPAELLRRRSPLMGAGDQAQVYSALVSLLHDKGQLDLADIAVLLAAKPRLERFCNEFLLSHIEAGAITARHIQQTQPRFIALLPGRDYLARVAAVAAQAEGIVSFDIQTVFATTRTRYKRTLADYQLVIESESKKLFQEIFDLPDNRTLLAGCSKIGSLRKSAAALSRDEMRRKAGLTHEFHTILACSPFLDDDRAIVEKLTECLDVFPDMHISFRLHPSPSEGYLEYLQSISQKTSRAKILDKLDLAETIASADLTITRFSNVGLEAGLVGRDVICCNFTDVVPPVRLDKMGVASLASSPQGLLDKITDFRAKGPDWNALQDSRAAFVDANSQFFGESVSGFILDLMQTHASQRKAGPQ